MLWLVAPSLPFLGHTSAICFPTLTLSHVTVSCKERCDGGDDIPECYELQSTFKVTLRWRQLKNPMAQRLVDQAENVILLYFEIKVACTYPFCRTFR